ncbi:MAG: hypothetical protein JO359_05535, partial [Candidatus Eremiobacteraeota bacterium]|nr:hypothetical protein [Candidatus Eremiobacteraeota bacterium]
MRRVISVAVLVALAALCAAAIPGHAANEILLRRSAGTVGYKHDLGAPFITVTGVQAVADDAYAITQASSVGVVVFPDSSLVTLGASTTIRVGAFRLAQNGNGSTIQIPSGGGELRLEIRHPQGQRSNYQFSTSIMNLAVRGTIALLADAPTGDTLTCLDCGANDVVVTAGGRDYALLSG